LHEKRIKRSLIKMFVYEQFGGDDETNYGMTGATGAPLGVALLQALREMPEVETHLVMSKWAKTTIELETPYSAREVARWPISRTARRTRPPPSHQVHFVPTA
jgi:hypothetical protein